MYSFSKLSSIDNCPYQYYLQYVKECGACKWYASKSKICENKECIYFGRTVEENSCCNKYVGYDSSDNAFSHCGSLVHEILEGYAKGKFDTEELAELFELYFDDYVKSDFPFSLREKYYDSSIDYLKNFTGFDGYDIIGSEIYFVIELDGGVLFRGIIDLLLRDKKDGRFIICDYKSKSSFKSKQEKAEYVRQLYLYSMYVMKEYGEFPKELVFILFRKQDYVTFEFKEELLEEAKEWAHKQIKKINDRKEFEANPKGFFCWNLCNYSKSCLKKKG